MCLSMFYSSWCGKYGHKRPTCPLLKWTNIHHSLCHIPTLFFVSLRWRNHRPFHKFVNMPSMSPYLKKKYFIIKHSTHAVTRRLGSFLWTHDLTRRSKQKEGQTFSSLWNQLYLGGGDKCRWLERQSSLSAIGRKGARRIIHIVTRMSWFLSLNMKPLHTLWSRDTSSDLPSELMSCNNVNHPPLAAVKKKKRVLRKKKRGWVRPTLIKQQIVFYSA